MPAVSSYEDPECLRRALGIYQQARPLFQLLVDYLTKVRLPRLALRLGLYPVITGRVKSLESLAEKLQRPGKHYGEDVLDEVTDLAGVRVIVPLLADVQSFAEAVDKEFVVEGSRSVDKRAELGAEQFGYLSRHLIIQLREPPSLEELNNLPGSEVAERNPEGLVTLKAELQIRTLCQHAWAEVFHTLGYKNEFRLPALWRREFAKAAALLETCDKEFQEIRDYLAVYESSYGAYMEEAELLRLAGRLEVLRKVDPNNVQAAHRLLRTYLALGSWEKCAALMQEIPALCRYPPALRDCGVALMQRHSDSPHSAEFKRGQALLREAVRDLPRDIDALCSLGGSYRRQEKWEEALDCYRKAFQLEPDNPYALGQYLVCELLHGLGPRALWLAAPALRKATERCSRQLEVGVNLPWAAFDAGLFHLYQGELEAAVRFTALGIHRAQVPWMIESALRVIRQLADRLESSLPGAAVLQDLLECGYVAKGGSGLSLQSLGAPPMSPPVLILAGGCAGTEEAEAAQLNVLKEALRGFRGTIVSGGTVCGIAGLVGELQQLATNQDLSTVGYIPLKVARSEHLRDPRYKLLRVSEGEDFSVREPLLFWRDFLSAGGHPRQVKLLGLGGGAIAACEYRMALAFGARVGILAGSGREADAFLQDPLWREGAPRGAANRLHPRVRALSFRFEEIRAFLEEALEFDGARPCEGG